MRRHPGCTRALVFCALSVSCEDPASPTGRGAASVQWATSTLNSKTPQCVPGPHWSNAPATAPDQPQTSASEAAGGFVVDGEQGGVVRCSVLQQGQRDV